MTQQPSTDHPTPAGAGRRLLPRRLAAAGLGALLSLGSGVAAWAVWSAAGSGSGNASAGTLTAPTISGLTKPVTTTVRVAWAASPSPGGEAVKYYVTRQTGSGTTAAACGTSAAATTTATTCDDTNVPSGVYTYVVNAVYRTWTAASAGSAISVGADVPIVTGIVRTGGAAETTSTNGTVSWTVTFSKAVVGVDMADFATVTGSGLGGSPAVTSVSGSGATYTVTASTGQGNGTLGLNLVDNDSIADGSGPNANRLGGTGTGNGNFTGPTYSLTRTIYSVTLVNGGTAGIVDTGDQIVVRFTRAMRFSTICGSWTDVNGTLVDANTLTGGTKVTVRLDGNGNGNGSGDDTLSLTGSNCVGAFRFGTINLGAPDYVNGTRNFTNSPMTYDTATFTLTIRLGPSDGAASVGSVTTAAPTYSADPGVTDAGGSAVNNSPFGLSAQKWF